MTRGDLLKQLFLAFASSDAEAFRKAAVEIVGDEEQKNNKLLARDLFRILESSKNDGLRSRKLASKETPRDREKQFPLFDIRYSERSLSEVVLKDESRNLIERVVEEFSQSELLRLHGLEPKKKLLFCGPPGCGKTICAEAISHQLGMPMLYVRFDSLISSLMGETAANLRRIFDYAVGGRWVVFFDEFDAIGRGRNDPNDLGELKRVVNSFLQILDSFEGNSVVIAATNHERLLDSALWRRFDEVIQFPRPSVSEIKLLLKLKLRNFPQRDLDLGTVAEQLKGMAHADIERVCIEAMKTALLARQKELDGRTLEDTIQHQRGRLDFTVGTISDGNRKNSELKK